jgi:hypothetical protein
MFEQVLRFFFKTSHERQIRKIQPRVNAINEFESKVKGLSDEKLKAKTAEFKQKLENGAKLDDILIEGFAVCREASKRVLGMRHYDVQLIGGMVCTRARSPRCDRRGQDARRHPALLPQRPRGQGRARRHRERLPRPPRRRVDGAPLQFLG